ncbi:MAG: alpha/beta fold hydrolase [Lachnospiraceae bacterium]|nr:alpha/beta fold hydrolase [Lachnospiraceae bacterium]
MEIKNNHVVDMSGHDTFVFVHGAWSGAWSWDKVRPLLEALGHTTYAVDLPGHGEDSSDIATQTGDTFARKVVDLIESLPCRVILVGNSMGGSVISRVGEMIPDKIKKIVYLAAFLLQDGESGNGIDGSGIQPVDWLKDSDDGKTALRHPPEIPDWMTPEQAEEEREREARRKPRESIAALSGKVHVTKKRWGSIRRYYIHCTEDECIEPALQIHMLENLPCRKVYVMKAGHTPHYYQPEAVSVILHDVALDI